MAAKKAMIRGENSMSLSSRLCLLLTLLSLGLRFPAGINAEEGATRTFPAQKCRFTLPEPDWAWSDKEMPSLLFMASNKKGFVINLATLKTPGFVQLNEQFVKGFEDNYFRSGPFIKRSSRFVTFRGLPTFQAESSIADGRTAVIRVFAAHDLLYHLTLVGARDPIENDPTFETLMQGFDFTVSPTPAPKTNVPGAMASDHANSLGISRRMGQIAGACVMGIIVLVFLRWALGKGKANKA
jgi:hypothetical protein